MVVLTRLRIYVHALDHKSLATWEPDCHIIWKYQNNPFLLHFIVEKEKDLNGLQKWSYQAAGETSHSAETLLTFHKFTEHMSRRNVQTKSLSRMKKGLYMLRYYEGL